jgi:hypothetical protein
MGKREISAIIIFFLITKASFAQDAIEKNIEPGMYVKLTPCKIGSQYISMDVYTKTRFNANEKPSIDSTTGEGLFEYFFKPGDFDASRLPCTYGNKSYRVASLHLLPSQDGNEKRVMLLYTADPYKIIWVEFDKAVELEEISW